MTQSKDVSKGKRGRPSKKDLANTKQLSKREQAARLREFRQRLLLNPQSEAFIKHLFNTALDDEAKNQGVAMKLLADRLLPVAGFTHDGKQQASVSINISGIGAEHSVDVSGTAGDDIEDAEYTELDDPEGTHCG